MNESLMYGSEDEYNAVTLMLSLTTHASGDIDLCLGGETYQGKPSRGKRKPHQ
jgi:hypothetical protein